MKTVILSAAKDLRNGAMHSSDAYKCFALDENV